MNDEPPGTSELKHRVRKRFGAGCFVGGLGVLIFLYLLSPPFAEMWILHNGGLMEDVVWIVYAPIRFAVEHLEFVEEFYEWYFSLFPDSW